MANDLLQACMRRASELFTTVKPDVILSDTKLKEFVNSAYESIVLKLANQGLQNLRQEVILLNVPVGTTALSELSTPPLPAMFSPVRIWERQAGGNSWAVMTMVIDHLPVNAIQTDVNRWWEFRDGAIRLLGTTGLTDLKIHFTPRGADFQMPRDTFAFPDLVNPTAFLAASRALGGNQYYDGMADQDLYNIASIATHLQQSKPVRLQRRRSGARRYN